MKMDMTQVCRKRHRKNRNIGGYCSRFVGDVDDHTSYPAVGGMVLGKDH